jgi:hypothetical protein
MSIPQNLKKVKEAFSIEQVNAHLSEGWCLVAITQRAGAMGPLYTMGWTEGGGGTEKTRQSSANRARGIAE